MSPVASALGFLACLGTAAAVPAADRPAARPNVVIVMLDDVGHGDLGCHGSPFIPTPCLDALHASGARLADFHVAPMCSPTRGQLMTGRDALRNGSSLIASSRMMVRADVPMMPAMFAAAGYATGLFGKWHLGENHPHRPQDRGFRDTLWYPMQEISSLPDHWGNDYFDPVLRLRDGESRKYTGYCTDIFFAEAIGWMRRCREVREPFLCCLSLNVCHGPQWAPGDLRETIARRFPDLRPGQVGYLAMLANADENFGRLEAFLAGAGLRDDTILLFLSDNGGYALIGRHNSGMRDGKASLAEGGHRAPCFLRWPAGGIGGGRDVAGLTQVQDLLPTLLDLCGIAPPAGSSFDGASLARALRGEASVPDRTLVIQYGQPEPFRRACVLRGSWRLLSSPNGIDAGEPALYDLAADPMQRTNLLASRPAVAGELRAAYDAWWAATEPLARQRAWITLGHPGGGRTVLSTAEWRENALHVVAGLREGAPSRGAWDVEVVRDGTYEFALRRWPESSGLALAAAAPPWTPRDTATPEHPGFAAGVALPIAGAEVRLGERRESKAVAGSDAAAVFRIPLGAGRTELEASFRDAGGRLLCPAYFVTVTRLDRIGKPATGSTVPRPRGPRTPPGGSSRRSRRGSPPGCTRPPTSPPGGRSRTRRGR